MVIRMKLGGVEQRGEGGGAGGSENCTSGAKLSSHFIKKILMCVKASKTSKPHDAGVLETIFFLHCIH